jgi:hypothetical protein
MGVAKVKLNLLDLVGLVTDHDVTCGTISDGAVWGSSD